MGHQLTYESIPCCLELPDSYLVKARYAIIELLKPLGLKPDFVGRDELVSGGFYYGSDFNGLGENVLLLKFVESVRTYYQNHEAYSFSAITVGEKDLRWLLLFPFEEDLITLETRDREGPRKAALLRYFDIVAASFFWLADWQFEGTSSTDVHGRFSYAHSIQAQQETGCLPFVDYYREILALNLKKIGFKLKSPSWGGKKTAVCITHDIDYLKKWRKGMIYRDVVQRRKAPYQILLELGEKRDPFKYSFDWMKSEEAKRGFKATWFIKTGGDGRNDVRYDYKSPWLKSRISDLIESGHEVGLHGSYFTADDGNRYDEEMLRLRELVENVTATRQHYLRYKPGVSTMFYERNGVKFDSSIAFADHEGFRTGTCFPHQIFDNENNQVTDLVEFPLSLMENTLKTYRKMNIEEAIEASKNMLRLCERFGGVLVILWHNIIKDNRDFPGLDRHFEEMLVEMEELECFVEGFSKVYESWGR